MKRTLLILLSFVLMIALLLFFVLTMAFAQNITDTTGANIPEENPTFVSKWNDNTEYMILMEFLMDSNIVVVYQNFTALNLLALYEQYEVECYNDSTAHYYYTLCDWECWDVPCEKDEKINIWSEMECPEHWKHKQPTFQGFMKWLKEKQ